MKQEIKKENSNKDLRPIWIYLLLSIIAPIFLGIVAVIINIPEKYFDVISVILSGIIFIIFIILYHDMIIKDIKRLTKRQLLFILIMTIIVVIINIFISDLFENFGVKMNNQETVEKSLMNYKLLMTLNVCLFAPLIEELLFRYSINTIIKKDIMFIITSSIIFGIMHEIGIVTTLYIFIGIMLAITYIKTDKNIVASTIIHIINNLVSVITMFLLLK